MDAVKIILKSDSIVRALMELGAKGNEEVAETTINDLTLTNYDQIDADLTKEDAKVEYELLDIEVLDRIKNEGLEVMLKIIDRAYREAYYECNGVEKIVI